MFKRRGGGEKKHIKSKIEIIIFQKAQKLISKGILLKKTENQIFSLKIYLNFRVLKPLNAELEAEVYAPKSFT
jgi:hypothetical protein